MTRPRGRWLQLTVLVASLAGLIASIVWTADSSPSWRPGPWTMTRAVSREGQVHDLAGAGRAAARFGDRWDLHVGEVMRFSNGYYAQLLDSGGNGATAVLVDSLSGTVRLEFGPAMMWNTAYGMMPAGTRPGTEAIGPDQAVRIADRWLSEHRPGLHAAEPDRFPGYFTLHTLRDGRIVGMLSVNASTGQVWYHTWHGRFLQMQRHTGST
ncbi:hypothetical protein [Streptomyces humi]|uniref:hypothetical protein n=1 Tax=Streptomyces humi TaxID=1428620 RepID=UPI0006289AB0|nr:hypothetical protein [Streptomyces humi]